MPVEPINTDWSSKGAAGDALERVPHDAPFLAVWIVDGAISWSKANTDLESLAVIATVAQEMAGRCVRDQFLHTQPG
jgi:hypothetical protein